MRQIVRFLRNRRLVEIDSRHARSTLLDWLRLEDGAAGTKEGCAEGDCGACTVVLARLRDGRVVHEPVNSCILLTGQADGAALITVSDLAQRDGTLHPVQAAMLAHHAAQCGFCTPGIVMSLFAQHQSDARPIERQDVLDQLAGNLCRCTGYRPIVDAAVQAGMEPPVGAGLHRFTQDDLAALDDMDDVFVGTDDYFFAAPRRETTLQDLVLRHPEAKLVSGATDAGLAVTKRLERFDKVIWLGRTEGLDAIELDAGWLRIGATATLARAAPALAAISPDLGEVMRRFGSPQVRASGTVGGNIANGSPIGDLAPCLIALGATLELQHGATRREIALEDFFIAYGRQDRSPGEYVRGVRVPLPSTATLFRAFKISKRSDEDISTVLGAFAFASTGRTISSARIAYGGMAGIPNRAIAAERAIRGASLDAPTTWDAAIAALDTDFAPIDDLRASAAYRRLVAANLLRKALIEIAGAPIAETRLAAPRGSHHVA
jgi:xanthine dehydrogenase small subunit